MYFRFEAPPVRGRAKGRAFVFSLLLHAAVVGAILLLPRADPQRAEEAEYERYIVPQREHIIWYPLIRIPVISPPEKTAATVDPRGEVKRAETLLRDSPTSETGKQIILRPNSPTVLHKDVPAPNVVALQGNTPGPAIPKPQERPEVPDPDPAPAPPPPAPRRQFVPPPPPPKPVTAAPRLTEPPPVVSPVVSATEPNSVLRGMLDGAKPKVYKPFAPPVVKPGAAGGMPSDFLVEAPQVDLHAGSSISALAVNLDAIRPVNALPDGNRQPRVSSAPESGSNSSGDPQPGLSLKGATSRPAAPPDEAAVRGIPKDFSLPAGIAPLQSSLSAPLPPSARSIPQSIEARFRGRVVYTIIIPMKKVPGYAGDWVIWFAPRDTKVSPQTWVRGPLPLFKDLSKNGHQPGPEPHGRVVISGIIDHNGHASSLAIVQSPSPEAGSAAISDLECWNFLPALSNHIATDVEVLVEVSFASSPPPLHPQGPHF